MPLQPGRGRAGLQHLIHGGEGAQCARRASRHDDLNSPAGRDEGAAPIRAGLHQQIEGKRGDIIGQWLHGRILRLIHHLHIGAALIAGFGLHRSAGAFHLLQAYALGGTADHTAHAHMVPPRAAQGAAAITRAGSGGPVHHHARHGRTAAAGAGAFRDARQPVGIEPRREAGKMHLKCGG